MALLTLTPTEARRLAVAAQQLEAPRPNPSRADLLDTIRRITCLQIDPINVVARTQLLVPFSRLGNYDPADLEGLLWDDKALFEYWAHAASIVLADDYPIFRPQMTHRELGNGIWQQRAYQWWAANAGFRQGILDEMAARGPLFAEEIASRPDEAWAYENTWGSSKDVGQMLDMMWYRGDVTVTRRQGNGYGLKKQWGLMEHQLGSRVHEPPVDRPSLVRRAVERAMPALGPARLRDVRRYFTRHTYPGLNTALAGLEADGVIQKIAIRDDGGDWPGPWYLHRDLLPELERLRRGEWRPQTVLLSPFDNLIADRDRAHLLFDFFYRIEIYTSPAKRQYGYYVMPILHGETLIGRVDPKMDRQNSRLVINAIHLEPGSEWDSATRAAVTVAIESLAGFLGAESIEFPSGYPSP
ncbi:conserved protein of unknown function [Candidatus Promineifilum breve]|uniref:Winged helix-turn-helix domain-containing protein n=1 Tax=Candidatus Promineifilum breve TaxID=1806508 RepID=A0A160T0X5_9CHLR|nr:crosslink repair DNA glycosylase YcaQ family protein [Candidatus Promineifilum breve]CUS03631.2 conserved protein of unknown function [Candidatus Promineifilum breve]